MLTPEFDGIGEFEEWDELKEFLNEHWSDIIATWNKYNDNKLPVDTPMLTY